MPIRLSKIDELTRPDHTFLEPQDECFYLGEYTARKGFAFSDTNDLVQNLKKPMDRKGKPEWRYKEWAIRRAAELLRAVVDAEWLQAATVVPVPPSKMKSDPEYDDRLVRILQELGRGTTLDVRELVTLNRNLQPAHLSTASRDIEALVQSMTVDVNLLDPLPRTVGIFDDVLTTGAHFKAVQIILRQHFPDIQMVGFFLARRAPESTPI